MIQYNLVAQLSKMPLVSNITIINAVYHFPSLLSNRHWCLLMSCGLIKWLWFWWVPLYNTNSVFLHVNINRIT